MVGRPLIRTIDIFQVLFEIHAYPIRGCSSLAGVDNSSTCDKGVVAVPSGACAMYVGN